MIMWGERYYGMDSYEKMLLGTNDIRALMGLEPLVSSACIDVEPVSYSSERQAKPKGENGNGKHNHEHPADRQARDHIRR